MAVSGESSARGVVLIHVYHGLAGGSASAEIRLPGQTPSNRPLKPGFEEQMSEMVPWRRIPADVVSSPIVEAVPYLELKLEHPPLDPDTYGERFFPDAVPYTLDGTSRIFYWRPRLGPISSGPEEWQLVCATPHQVGGIGSLPADGPPLVTDSGNGVRLVVEGTVGGPTSSRSMASYSAPAVVIESLSEARLELTVDGSAYALASGDRRRIRLGAQAVDLENANDCSKAVTPEFVIRYPGPRQLHHPAAAATYRLFPSFGLDLNDLSNPVSVPTQSDEVDEWGLAEAVDIDLSHRPYPERVLWQAFAHTAFNLHADSQREIGQLDSGHIVVQTDSFIGEQS